MNMRGREEGNINQYLADTIASVFDCVYTIDVQGSTNRELCASDNEAMTERLALGVEKLENQELADMMRRVDGGLTAYEAGGYLMTDDKAPVELLGMRVIDDLIMDEVDYYKEIYDEKGIRGVLERVL